jgi:hypothetical protein
MSRNRHPAIAARSRAFVTVSPVILGARHDAAEEADATLEVPVSASGSIAVTTSTDIQNLSERPTTQRYLVHRLR